MYPLYLIGCLNFRAKIMSMHVPGVPTSFGQEFSKKSLNDVTKSNKTRESLFTY